VDVEPLGEFVDGFATLVALEKFRDPVCLKPRLLLFPELNGLSYPGRRIFQERQ
jgi:hypothetical protein